MKTKSISIIIPVYNVEKYIERCVRSLFEQTFENIEYIFVDDWRFLSFYLIRRADLLPGHLRKQSSDVSLYFITECAGLGRRKLFADTRRTEISAGETPEILEA